MTTDAVRRTRTTLADGREFFYYDDSEPYLSGGATRRLDDPRPLPDRFTPVVAEDGTQQPVTGPQMRYDVLTGEWIPMATHRMNRTFLPGPDT
ncbi:MAG TPA: galactose-1-phosphate uridylyltransferase, partial [Candidatus Ruania gallistercoris]|nr:galactose-1-phosphate uridylyltransferase [Candidatus Ruania gallistercoris]